jgi:hypothetical protein
MHKRDLAIVDGVLDYRRAVGIDRGIVAEERAENCGRGVGVRSVGCRREGYFIDEATVC